MNTATHPHLAEFLAAYIQTALWSSTDNTNEQGGEPLDANFTPGDLAPETLARFTEDCAKFITDWELTLQAAVNTGRVKCGPDFDVWGRAGHDFWLTRCGHGAGFWDGDWPEPAAQVLTDASKSFGNLDLYVGDDGRLYV